MNEAAADPSAAAAGDRRSALHAVTERRRENTADTSVSAANSSAAAASDLGAATTDTTAAAAAEALGATAPPAAVLAAFGVAPAPRPERLPGGRGLTWRAGATILRPAGPRDEAVWKSDVLESLPTDSGFTVPRPLRTVDGGWLAAGWQALERVAGSAEPTRVRNIIAAGTAFHTALARALEGQPPPTFIALDTGRWSRADRLAWDEPDPAPDPALDAPIETLRATDPLFAALADATRPIDEPPAIIHGDLLGNVLFSERLPPAIIDWAPYFRPPGYAAAIAVTDAVVWHGVGAQDLANDLGLSSWRQLVLRALTFRIATQHLAGRWDSAFDARHAPVVAAALALPD